MSLALVSSIAVPPLPVPSAADLAGHRGALLRFARRKIRDEHLAEDAVQDALVAALASRQSFQGQSALRTWLIGILNHKIQDLFRREGRYVRPASADDGDGPEEEAIDRLARLHGEPAPDPLVEVARRRMHAALVDEVELLPETLKDVFRLQAVEGVATEDVCRQLNISEANCWVRLHRARKRLSQRMQAHF